jgi:hypothetical protein
MKISTYFLEFQREGRNWTVDKVLGVILHIMNYKPFLYSSSGITGLYESHRATLRMPIINA